MPRQVVKGRYEPVFDAGDERYDLRLDRAQAGLSLCELARRCGCSHGLITRWEHGIDPILPKWYPRIIAALDGQTMEERRDE